MDICEIMKTLNLDFIRLKMYLQPYEPGDSYDVFLKFTERRRSFVILRDDKGMYECDIINVSTLLYSYYCYEFFIN